MSALPSSAPVLPGVPTPAPPAPGVSPLPGPLHLVVVRTPGPPLQDSRLAVPLVLPGRRPRPAPPPGPRPRLDDPARRPGAEPDFGPSLTRRSDLPDAAAAGRRVVTLATSLVVRGSTGPAPA